jgi:hypothetical protein
LEECLKGRDHLGDKAFMEDNIKLNSKNIGCEDGDWIHMYPVVALVNMVMGLQVPKKALEARKFSLAVVLNVAIVPSRRDI